MSRRLRIAPAAARLTATVSVGPPRGGAGGYGERELDRRAELDRFLAGVERQAFGRAVFTLRDREEALDAVQDAMLRLVRGYAGRPAEEWPGLFYRILENRIRDLQRRRLVRNRVMAWLPSFRAAGEEAEDAIATAPDPACAGPEREAAGDIAMEALRDAVEELPARQRQAFLLRAMDNLDVAATAAAMGVSAGSVKTHYSRALARLREKLGDHWP